jgi:hypothetical protein
MIRRCFLQVSLSAATKFIPHSLHPDLKNARNGRMISDDVQQSPARGHWFDETRFMTSPNNLPRDVEVGGVESWATRTRTERDDRDSIVAVVFVNWMEVTR